MDKQIEIKDVAIDRETGKVRMAVTWGVVGLDISADITSVVQTRGGYGADLCSLIYDLLQNADDK